jgi:hypothetical protein
MAHYHYITVSIHLHYENSVTAQCDVRPAPNTSHSSVAHLVVCRSCYRPCYASGTAISSVTLTRTALPIAEYDLLLIFERALVGESSKGRLRLELESVGENWIIGEDGVVRHSTGEVE